VSARGRCAPVLAGCVLGGALVCGSSSAHADPYPVVFAEGGVGAARYDQETRRPEGEMRFGIGWGATTKVALLGLGLQLLTHVGKGSQGAFVGRVARFFDDGADWGVLLDGGVTRGLDAFGAMGALSLAAPYGLQVSAVWTIGGSDRRSLSGLVGVDLLRLFARLHRDAALQGP
jgi:hypothetical protein